MLAGMTILSGFELAGERLAVAYETRDQEQEHSCFSDNTRADFVADQPGILAVFRGEEAGDGPLVREVARAVDPALAVALERRLEETLALLRALPQPFDSALRAEEGSPEREALLAALVSLERQAELLAALGLRLGHDIALRPGG
jgi:putative iron-regulated protein